MHEKEIQQNFASRSQQIGGVESENFAAISAETMWVGGYWTSGKHLKHYGSFSINGITIPVRSFCYIMIEKSEHLVAYILDLYEDKKSQKKMKVRWLHKSKEIKSPIPPPQPLENELFMTRYTQVLRLECCDGVVYVLTPNHFEVSMPNLSTSGEHVYVCGRHFGNEGFKPYDLSTMKGYWSQKIFHSGLIPPYLSDIARANTQFHEDEQSGPADFHEDEQAGSGQLIKSGVKAPRSARRRAVGRYDLLNEEGDWTLQQESCRLNYDASKTSSSSAINLLKVVHGTGSGRATAVFGQSDLLKAGNRVEVLCDDSGMKGCWFRCTVLETSTWIKVRYDDVLEVDSDKKLEEWVSINSISPAEKPGFRIPGRQMIRPLPPEVEMASAYELGSAVDVWGGEGWWEGILVSRNGSGQVKVAFSEEYTAWFDEPKVRISREWIDGEWLVVPPDVNIIGKISGLHREMLVSGDGSFPLEFLPGTDATSQTPHLGAEGREGTLPDHQPVAASYPANKFSALKFERPSTSQALEHASDKGKGSSANLKSAAHQVVRQVPILSECQDGMNLPNHCSKHLGKAVVPAPVPLEDLNSKCMLAHSCRTNMSEDSGSSQLQQLDLNRDKENDTHMIDKTSEGLRPVSRKRYRDVEDSMFSGHSKSGLVPSRDPSADVLANETQEQEGTSVGVFTFDKLTDAHNVEVQHPQYGFEQVSSPTGAPGGGPLFNSVSVRNLVLSR